MVRRDLGRWALAALCATWLCACEPATPVRTAPPRQVDCVADADCGARLPDLGPCLQARCTAGTCNAIDRPDQTVCGAAHCDAQGFFGAATCKAGACVAPAALACAAGACQIASCDAASGCGMAARADGTACDVDGSACTPGDHCKSGSCVAGKAIACDDGNPCTADGCDPKTGDCTAAATPGPCSDGNACTTADACAGGTCKGQNVACGDGDPCTADTCSAKTGCEHAALANCYSGSDACIASDAKPVNCDDNNPCTTDGCDSKAGCAHTANALACDDGSACTVGDACAGGLCTAGAKLDCGDGNPCTDDGCDLAEGCTHTANSAACEDGDLCSSGDACAGGTCGAGTAQKGCDDANPCTSDACQPQTGGCSSSASAAGTACDDGILCTGDGACADGSCKQVASADCDDGDTCTADSCDAKLGCVHAGIWGCKFCTGKPYCSGADLPAFALVDANWKSSTFKQTVQPLDYKGKPIVVLTVIGN